MINDIKIYEEKYKEAWEYYQQVISRLSIILNKVNQTNHNPKYWEIIIGGWVWLYIMVIFYKFWQMDQYIYVKKPYPKELKPMYEIRDLQSIILQLGWNEYIDAYIFESIIEFSKITNQTLDIKDIKNKWFNEVEKSTKDINWIFCKSAVQNSYKYFLTEFNTAVIDYNIMKNGMDILLEKKFCIENIRPDFSLRTYYFMKKSFDNAIDFIFWKSLIEHFPICCFEGYSQIHKSIFNKYQLHAYENIFVFNDLFYESSYLNVFVAFQVETFHTKLFTIQHGGVYGMYRVAGYECLERRLSDKFISWGWNGKNVIPMPAIKNLNWNIRKKTNKKIYKDIGLVTTISLTRPVLFGFCQNGLDSKKYDENIFLFLNKLLGEGCSVQWRPYAARCNYLENNQVEKVIMSLNKIKKTKLKINYTGTIQDFVSRKKIIVIDHCSTTLLETIANNIPTILFWNKEFTPLRAATEKIFDELHDVGILHYTPEETAIFIKKNYDNIEEWWNRTDVQNSIKNFVDIYAKQDENIVESYLKLFKTGNGHTGVKKNVILYKLPFKKHILITVKQYLKIIKVSCKMNLNK